MAEPSWAVKMLGPELLTHADPTKPTGVLRPTDEVLAQKKFVILYFSASWCPPCKKFTSFFSIVYEDMLEGADKDEVEVVLVSQCHTISDFNEYYAGMQWAAVPYPSDKREEALAVNDVHGLPVAMVFRVADGAVVSKDCRELINTKKKLTGIFQ